MDRLFLKSFLFTFFCAPVVMVVAMQQEPQAKITCEKACQTEECKLDNQNEAWTFVIQQPIAKKVIFLGGRLCITIRNVNYDEEHENVSIVGILSLDGEKEGTIYFMLQKGARGFFARYFFTHDDDGFFNLKETFTCKGVVTFQQIVCRCAVSFFEVFLNLRIKRDNALKTVNKVCPKCFLPFDGNYNFRSEHCCLKCFHVLHKKCFAALISEGKVRCPFPSCNTEIETADDYI
jgi:hypothetical protein